MKLLSYDKNIILLLLYYYLFQSAIQELRKLLAPFLAQTYIRNFLYSLTQSGLPIQEHLNIQTAKSLTPKPTNLKISLALMELLFVNIL